MYIKLINEIFLYNPELLTKVKSYKFKLSQLISKYHLTLFLAN